MGDPNCEFYDRVRGLRSAGDFFRLRLSRDRSSGVWERLVVWEITPGRCRRSTRESSRDISTTTTAAAAAAAVAAAGGGETELFCGVATVFRRRHQKLGVRGGLEHGARRAGRENNGSPYSRTAYIFEHGVWRRLERLGDTGIAKTAQNWILLVASRRFHSAHTRDRRRARGLLLRDRRLRRHGAEPDHGESGNAAGMPQPSLNATSVAPELMRTWMHCTLFDPWMVGLRERNDLVRRVAAASPSLSPSSAGAVGAMKSFRAGLRCVNFATLKVVLAPVRSARR